MTLGVKGMFWVRKITQNFVTSNFYRLYVIKCMKRCDVRFIGHIFAYFEAVLGTISLSLGNAVFKFLAKYKNRVLKLLTQFIYAVTIKMLNGDCIWLYLPFSIICRSTSDIGQYQVCFCVCRFHWGKGCGSL